MVDITVRSPITSSKPAGRCRVFKKDGAWWLRQWHELLPNAESGVQVTPFDSEEKAEEEAETLVNSGKYIRADR